MVFLGDRVAIVHESFAQYGEAERIAEEIAKLAPHADILSAVSVDESLSHYLRSRAIKTTWMNHLPAKKKWSHQYAPLFPLAIRALDMSQYSVVISSCAGFAKGVQCRHDAVHLCYCHTVRPSIWRSKEYARAENVNGTTRLLLKPLLAALRQFDRALAVQPDYYVAKSRGVADQIKKCYGRNAYVVHPPVETSRFYASQTPDDYLLIVSDFFLTNRSTWSSPPATQWVNGSSLSETDRIRQRLESLAGPSIRFLGPRTERQVVDLLARSRQSSVLTSKRISIRCRSRQTLPAACHLLRCRQRIRNDCQRRVGHYLLGVSRPAIVEAIEQCVE